MPPHDDQWDSALKKELTDFLPDINHTPHCSVKKQSAIFVI